MSHMLTGYPIISIHHCWANQLSKNYISCHSLAISYYSTQVHHVVYVTVLDLRKLQQELVHYPFAKQIQPLSLSALRQRLYLDRENKSIARLQRKTRCDLKSTSTVTGVLE